MVIPCKDIARALEHDLRSRTAKLRSDGKIPKLVTILLGNAPEQLSFVKIKQKLANKLDIAFEFVHIPTVPDFDDFISTLDKIANRSSTTGIIVQHPLPYRYDHDVIYQHISISQDIEGHKPGSHFIFPLALSALTGAKYVFLHNQNNKMDASDAIVDFQNDMPFFVQNFENKKIAIAGRGATGGGPIAKALDKMNIAYTITHSQTKHPDDIYKQADVIITATGKHIITSTNIKDGVILLNVGLRKKDGKLRGDYVEEDVENKASWYNKTPGGLGPIDVLYLYSNLLDTIPFNSEPSLCHSERSEESRHYRA